MCGINGTLYYRGDGTPDTAFAERQAHALRHRGPDDWGVWAEGPVALGHRRLAIVDLSPGGHQPMANEDGSLRVTYNGELYGWPELRAWLAGRGHRFCGHSDTEALLHLYEEYGLEMMQHLRGMFAFALWDARARRLVIARDRFGIKPLYYHDDGSRLSFASELKSLLLDPTIPRAVDERAIADYLTFGYVPSPLSVFRAVRKLPPAHLLVADASGVRVQRYWSLPSESDSSKSEEYYRERLRALLAEAVRLRLVADVPLGAFLSGGIDSSAVVALMSEAMGQPVKTFSIGFEEQDYSELEHARRVAKHLGTDHHELVVRPRALDLLPRLVWALDEPFADPSMIPTFYVAEMARRHVAVALSGDGGDEAYAGYSSYLVSRRYARMDHLPRLLRRALAWPSQWLHSEHAVGRRLRRTGLDVVGRHLDGMSVYMLRELDFLLAGDLRSSLANHDPHAHAREVHEQAARGIGDLPALLYLDAMTYLSDDILVKVDRTAMQHSLEVRVPLIDHKVMEFVARIPFEYKLRGVQSKWILRECVKDLLPSEILARGKQGFDVPLERWFGDDFGRLAREVLYDPRARSRGWLDEQAVESLIERPHAPGARQARQVWALTCLELWAQTYLDRDVASADRPLTAVPAPSHSTAVPSAT